MFFKKCTNYNGMTLRTMAIMARSIKYSEHGEPINVLGICEDKIDDPKDNQVLVKILAAPINPADINTIQGE